MTDDGMRHIRGLQLCDFLRIEMQVSAATASVRCCGLEAPTMGAVTKGFCAIQARATCAFGTPRASAMAATCSMTLRSASTAETRGCCRTRRFGSFRGFIPGARQASASQRAPGHYADALIGAQRHHFALFFAIQKIVVVLHGDEGRPAAQPRGVQSFAELPCPHRGSTEVSSFAALDDIVNASSVSSIGVG